MADVICVRSSWSSTATRPRPRSRPRRQREQTQAEFEKTVLADLAAARQKAAEFGKEEDKAAQRLALLTLKAPIAGTVQQLAAHTVGGVVTPAQALLVVVPGHAGLVVEARIPNKDVGFIHAGQEVQIKIETFNFTRYGLIQGKVLDVSRDAVMEQARSGQAARGRPGQGRRRGCGRSGGLGRVCRPCGARQHEHADRGRAGRAGAGDECDGGDQDRAAASDLLSAVAYCAVQAGKSQRALTDKSQYSEIRGADHGFHS